MYLNIACKRTDGTVLCLNKFKTMKLSLEALKGRPEAMASEELLESISGGRMQDCHQDLNDWLGDFGPYELPH